MAIKIIRLLSPTDPSTKVINIDFKIHLLLQYQKIQQEFIR